MSATYETFPARPGPVARTLNWLDERGPISWVIVLVGSFVFGGPLGLLVLGFILMTGRFGRRGAMVRRATAERFQACGMRMHVSRSSGNMAFDRYKTDTLARLEREQAEFEAFLGRLREARDKAEFDQYMDDRARAAQDAPAEPEATEPAEETGKPGAY
ncbi:DUF2852 domain-containing protein [Pseudothioclava arenosa]|uniref:DUF2852 domain-containing protein n=1 Tax=Pseudothioclava arenosa TaxID=1795308 RepID=A0A2A4CT35_9RHOB|nr:DUF2852 domain-containing protein [Pseudothioclava arenosa]PCD77296.1 hypothetical protein CLN94_05970 [Pseudothioclava arenosa]